MNEPTAEKVISEKKVFHTMDIEAIQKAIPHRYPFLFVDKVDIIEKGKRAIGYKCVTMNEWFFQGHFPGRPVMPGVIIVEALAQAAAALFLSQPEYSTKIAFFMKIDETKFRKAVVPGDILELHVEVLKSGGKVGRARGEAKVNNEIAAETDFTFAIIDK